MYKRCCFFLCLALASLVAQAQPSPARPPVDAPKMAWWKDAKFGMFIHWGVYSVPAGTYDGQRIPEIGEWIMNHGKIPVARYRAYAQEFNPVKYDPEAWVRMAKDAGMKYIVITSKHHDGFALFDSKVSTWDAVDATPYGKDLLKPLADACHKQGLKLGFYYSQAQDWNHPGGRASGGTWDRAQDGDFDTYLDQIAVPQVREILSNYGDVDILWWDTPQEMTPARAAKFQPLLAAHPRLITNNRLGGNQPGDTDTPEQFVPSTGFPGRNWETCQTMNDTWGYKSYDTNWKSPQFLIRNLADAVSKGGNFLLNVGPTAEGEIPAPSVERLAAIGRWVKINREAIYGTTASPFPYLSWGRATRKGQQLFLHVFDYPVNGQLRVPLGNKISRAYLLAQPATALAVTPGKQLSTIKLPATAPDPNITVVVVEFAGEPQVAPPPVKGKTATVSSQLSPTEGAQSLLDGDRETRWTAAKGERSATAAVNLGKPTSISCLIVDEPWHPWERKSQQLQLQYKQGSEWKTATTTKTGGAGHIEKFNPVTAQEFRLVVTNATNEPSLLEWQLYGAE
ncbi:MAG TPA: alpha-L-fucosidase [Hymenobacter sp.]|jgi:alpha-L-fucosidase|uniref:alpha-L-fucosidase n=1 Tax=Hymenobacter sp. TaxID=1898978 RepID=UPI002ED80437